MPQNPNKCAEQQRNIARTNLKSALALCRCIRRTVESDKPDQTRLMQQKRALLTALQAALDIGVVDTVSEELAGALEHVRLILSTLPSVSGSGRASLDARLLGIVGKLLELAPPAEGLAGATAAHRGAGRVRSILHGLSSVGVTVGSMALTFEATLLGIGGFSLLTGQYAVDPLPNTPPPTFQLPSAGGLIGAAPPDIDKNALVQLAIADAEYAPGQAAAVEQAFEQYVPASLLSLWTETRGERWPNSTPLQRQAALERFLNGSGFQKRAQGDVDVLLGQLAVHPGWVKVPGKVQNAIENELRTGSNNTLGPFLEGYLAGLRIVLSSPKEVAEDFETVLVQSRFSSTLARILNENTGSFGNLVANFAEWDADGDGALSEHEVDAAIVRPNAPAVLATIRAHRETFLSFAPDDRLTAEVFDRVDDALRGSAHPLHRNANFLAAKQSGAALRVARARSGGLYGAYGGGLPTGIFGQQGATGSCTVIAASIGLAQFRPEEIQEMVATSPRGGYEVRLPDRDQPVSIPSISDAEIAQYSAGDGMWLSLVEKAVAMTLQRIHLQLNEPVQEAFDGMLLGRGIERLTGHSSDVFLTVNTHSDELASSIRDALREGRIVLAASPLQFSSFRGPTLLPNGLTPNHAFAILRYDPKTQLFLIQNPWGSGGEPIIERRARDGVPDGRFWATADEIDRWFTHVAIERFADGYQPPPALPERLDRLASTTELVRQ